jgi:glycosyltransferase involved in cell wall biosynthesis
VTPRRGVRLWVDARTLNVSGLGRYLREILAGLLLDGRFESVTLLGDPVRLSTWLEGRRSEGEVHLRSFLGGLYSPAGQLSWLRDHARQASSADVYFVPHFDAPLLGVPARSVVTVHDLTPFRVPSAFGRIRRLSGRLLLGRAVRRATRVIAVSHWTRSDLATEYPDVAGRTCVIPNGVSEVFLEAGAAAGTRIGAAGGGRRGDPPYLLAVGNHKPHKNLVAAVETLARCVAEWPALRLVMVGQRYPGWDAPLRRAAELGVAERVELVDAVDDAGLVRYYQRCEALVFPSLYEGFGLPALEAMAVGAPVVASDRSSLPEIVGDAGSLVDPTDYDAMAAAVLRLRSEPAHRAELVRRGRERAARYSWRSAAMQTADLLHEVGIRRGSGDRDGSRRQAAGPLLRTRSGARP